ncbi:MAG TPA: ROK family protein [Phycisphaerales bacterium]|nr:ROK family protein [Phycisphaerales bacterium]|tara:strand:- start:61437 stop:62498 length:1062 start_codon:yes stop_codon:yes gene_type:complete
MSDETFEPNEQHDFDSDPESGVEEHDALGGSTIMHSERFAIGIDLGGTNIQAGVVNQAGEVLGRAKIRTEADKGFEKVMDRVAAAARDACEEAGVKMSMIHTAGIGVPGPIDPDKGIVVEAVNLRWNKAPVVIALSDRLSVPVYADNDVNVAVYGEWRAGVGENRSNLLGVWVGTGVGGGLVINSQLHRGAHHSAGEIGHMIIHPGAHLGSRSVEHNCSRTAIVHELIKLIKANHHSMLPSLTNGKTSKIKSKILSIAYEQGDDLVCTVINDSADLLGMAISNVVTLLSLDMVILGGGLVEAIGKPYVDIVRDAIRREAFPESLRQIKVEASTLGDDAGLVGAGIMALEEHWK